MDIANSSSALPSAGINGSSHNSGAGGSKGSTHGGLQRSLSQSGSSYAGSSQERGIGVGYAIASLLVDIGTISLSMIVGYYVMKKVTKVFDSDADERAEGRKVLARRLKDDTRIIMATNSYEEVILQDLIIPEEIDVTFNQIGGLRFAKEELYDLVILPLERPELFRGSRIRRTAPKGILLYGAPGTGKSMLAKAIAKESNAVFINLRLSTIMNKWFGESQKLVRALFTLARKLAPSIIFIDEIDAFMNERDKHENPAMANMKAEFLALWDGIGNESFTDITNGVLIIGATNRPYAVDKAIQRRLPRTFKIDLPNEKEREEILRIMLEGEHLDEDFCFASLARSTPGYSGSDLKELCQAASTYPVREYIERDRAVMKQKIEDEANRDVSPRTSSTPCGSRNSKKKKRRSPQRRDGGLFGLGFLPFTMPLDEDGDDESGLQEEQEEVFYDAFEEATLRGLSQADFEKAKATVGPTGAAAEEFEREEQEAGEDSSMRDGHNQRRPQRMSRHALDLLSSLSPLCPSLRHPGSISNHSLNASALWLSGLSQMLRALHDMDPESCVPRNGESIFLKDDSSSGDE